MTVRGVDLCDGFGKRLSRKPVDDIGLFSCCSWIDSSVTM